MSDQPTVSTERVMEILNRDPLGAAYLRAAIAEATVEIYAERIKQLEQQRTGAHERS